jgi:hypothetical protein
MPLILALLLGLVLRLLFIAKAPGIHFDEAWAANYAHKIASEPGFWPINAMSPYTHPSRYRNEWGRPRFDREISSGFR